MEESLEQNVAVQKRFWLSFVLCAVYSLLRTDTGEIEYLLEACSPYTFKYMIDFRNVWL